MTQIFKIYKRILICKCCYLFFKAFLLVSGNTFKQSPLKLLPSLHWLPVRSRIDFKIATLAYRCVHRLAPSYLSELVSLQVPKRSGLRSETDMLKLVVPTARKERWGERSFSCCAPRIWNALPLSLRSLPTLSSFRAQLKTFMFRIVFP